MNDIKCFLVFAALLLTAGFAASVDQKCGTVSECTGGLEKRLETLENLYAEA